MRPLLAAGALLGALGCASASTRAELHRVGRGVETLAQEAAAGEEPPPADDTSLAASAPLERILRLALARSPDLRESGARARGSVERARAASRLPDLELKYEQWGVPLGRPYALGDADTLMFGLRQTFPAPGSLDARGRRAVEEAAMELEAARARERDVVAQVKRAYYEYYRADREYRVHLEHVDLAMHAVDLARASYQAGRGTQQDVLRSMVELSRLHNELAALTQQQRSARAALNTLMARPADAPLAPPPDFQPTRLDLRVADLDRWLGRRRPALVAAARAVRRSEADLDEARARRRWPSLMVGADYWYMPETDSPHAYGAMVSLNLPWLNPRHGDEVRAAERSLEADRRALESARNTALFELRDAVARYEAARESFTIIDRDLLAQARQSYESAQAAFAAGRGDALGLLDALRSYLQVRIEQARALARLETALADVERAVGASLAEAARAEGRRFHGSATP